MTTNLSSQPKLEAYQPSSGCLPAILIIGVGIMFIGAISGSNGAFFWMFVGIIWLVVIFNSPAQKLNRRFSRASSTTHATVTRLWYEVTYDDESGNSTDYYLSYIFPGGQETVQKISSDFFIFAKEGDTVSVCYLLDQPNLSKIDWAATLSERVAIVEKK